MSCAASQRKAEKKVDPVFVYLEHVCLKTHFVTSRSIATGPAFNGSSPAKPVAPSSRQVLIEEVLTLDPLVLYFVPPAICFGETINLVTSSPRARATRATSGERSASRRKRNTPEVLKTTAGSAAQSSSVRKPGPNEAEGRYSRILSTVQVLSRARRAFISSGKRR